MLFHEIYGLYFQAVSAALAEATELYKEEAPEFYESVRTFFEENDK